MLNVPKDQILSRIEFENPWWKTRSIDPFYARLRPRAYFPHVRQLVAETEVRRAVILMGPRRVGKTVILHHVVQSLIDAGTDPGRICFISVDAPVYTGHALAQLIDLAREASPAIRDDLAGSCFVFDEIQYLRD